MRISTSLRTRFTVIFAILIIALTTLLSYVIGKHASEEVSSEIGNSLSGTAFQMADKLDSFMWSRKGEVEVLRKLDAIRNPNDLKNVRNLLEQLKKSFPAYSWIGLTDTKGKVLASTGGILTGVDTSKRPVHVEGRKGPYIGDVHDAVLLAKLLQNPSGEPLRFVDVAIPVTGLDGKFSGVLTAHLSWQWATEVEKSILQSIQHRSKTEVFVVSKKDNIVLLGPKNMVGQRLHLDSLIKAQSGLNHWTQETWSDGNSYITGFAYGKGYMDYKGLGWTVLVRQPIELAYAPIQKLQSFILLFGLLSALFFAMVAWMMAGQVTSPLRKITQAANKLKSGKFVEIPQPKGITEIEILSSSIRDLLQSLNQTETALGEMEVLAQHDRLTGLPNRIALDYYLEKATSHIQQHEASLTFLYIDLDSFKPVNDTHGHDIGDLLLQEVAMRLKKSIKGEDILARLGGDEFIVVLLTPIDQPIDEARKIAHRIIVDLREPFYINDFKIKIGCSIGGAVFPTDGTTPKDVMRSADAALYTAKRAGKNRLAFHNTGDHQVLVV